MSDLESLRVPELREMAKKLNVAGYGKLRKAELISAINKSTTKPPAKKAKSPIPKQVTQVFDLGNLPDELIYEVCKNTKDLPSLLLSSKRVYEVCKDLIKKEEYGNNMMRVMRWKDAPLRMRNAVARDKYLLYVPRSLNVDVDMYLDFIHEKETSILPNGDQVISFKTYADRRGQIGDTFATIQNAHVKLWEFSEAPKHLSDMSKHGGDEDFLALVPPSLAQVYKAGELAFLSEGQFGNMVSSKKLPDGSYVVISAHS